MFKFLVWHALILAGSCELFKEESGYVLNYAPVYKNYRPRDYHFNYAVSDPHTGDHKSQWEVKTNGVVRGGYSLLEPDGTTRIVEYIADDDGFRAVVNKVGTAVHPEVVHQVPVLPLVPAVSQSSHYRAYDGQVANYAPQILYNAEQNLGNQHLLNQGSTVGVLPQESVLQTPVLHENVASQQLGTLGVVPPTAGYNIESTLGTNQGHSSVNLARIDNIQQVPLQQANLGPIQETNVGSTASVQQVPLQGYSIEKVDEVPQLQQPNIGDINAGLAQLGQVPLPRFEGVLQSQGHDLGKIQGQSLTNLARFDVPLLQSQLGHPEVVPIPQRQNLVVIGGKTIDASALQGQVVPTDQTQDTRGYGQINLVPLQGKLENEALQGQNLARLDSVRLIQGQLGQPQGQNLEINGKALSPQGQLDNLGGVPLPQGQAVPVGYGQNLGTIQLGQGGLLQGQLGRIDQGGVVPFLQGQLGQPQLSQIYQGQNLDNGKERIDGLSSQGQAVPQEQVVPIGYGQNLGAFQLGQGGLLPFQGQFQKIEGSLDQRGVVPLQGQNLGTDLRVPLQEYNLGGQQGGLPQPQIEILGSGQPQEQVPGLVPVDPSYSTTIEYQGLGNDNRLKKDVYHSSYSEKVLKVVPSPRKGGKKGKKDFLIYYPESQSH